MTLIDILMATYNGERFVAEQVRSVLSQTESRWRLLVSDDCSSDATLAEVVRATNGDDRVRIVSRDVRYGGSKQNFMHLLSLSTAPYVMFCDQDDVWLPEKVSRTLATMRRLEVVHGTEVPLVVFCDMAVVDEQLNVIHPSFEANGCLYPSRRSFQRILAGNVAAGCTMMINRSCAELAVRAGCPRGLRYHDWWVMLLATAFGHVAYLDEQLSLYRQHSDNVTGAVKPPSLSNVFRIDPRCEGVWKACRQAGAFADAYADLLSAGQLGAACHYGAIATSATPMSGLAHLVASGCWMPGVRVLSQVIATVTLPAWRKRVGMCEGL